VYRRGSIAKPPGPFLPAAADLQNRCGPGRCPGMRRRFTPLLCLVALAAGGCFEAEITVTLNADGSGRQQLRLGLGEAAVGALRQATGTAEASVERGDPLDVFDANKVRAELRAAAVELVTHRVSERGQRRTVELTATFGDLHALRRNPLTGGARATWEVTPAGGVGQVRLVYYPQGADAWRAARAKARELARESDEVVEHFVASRLRAIDGLDCTLTLELPGDVVAHTANLTLTGKRTVAVRTRAADIRSATDLLVRLAPRFEVVFACPGFTCPGEEEPRAPAASGENAGKTPR